RKTLLIHAVSVGEVNATRELVKRLEAQSAPPRIVICVTTDTGHARARALYEDRHTVVRYPLDFSWAVRRFLDAVRPDAVLLIELEVWPNFVAACSKRGIAVGVVNGRLSVRSFGRYKLIRPLIRGAFARLAAVGVQDEDYRLRFIDMGATPDRVSVTGTMKWDTAIIADDVEGANEFAKTMGIDTAKPLVVCGSTGPDEERLMLDQLAPLDENLQILCAPRKPERFDEAAEAMAGLEGGLVRRSTCETQPNPGARVFLLDTIGELRKAYALADAVVVGRSFCPLYGSDMIEPIGLGKPTVIGPNTSDFADTMRLFLEGDGIIQVDSGETLGVTIQKLLADPTAARSLAERGRDVIRGQQGASDRHAAIANQLLARDKDASTR
ncbi:MAG: 3-deoxy-D-manno-octulosonic acid transferase, partial [Planctomycetota bacterium]